MGSSSSPDEINGPLMPAKSGVYVFVWALHTQRGCLLDSLITAEWCK